MKKKETLFLKSVILLITLAVVTFLVFLTIPFRNELSQPYEERDYLPIFSVIYFSSMPFLYGLYQSFKLLTFIDRNKAFSKLAISSLNRIKLSSLTISAIFTIHLPFIFKIADMDDAPGLMLIALIIIFATFVVAIFAAVLQKLLQNAIDIKSENELTV
ncbi:MAG TPA: DUF2975 domain-containing protein [Candidatus Dojkabacteria bacterium]|nr:DUF2975 domain-containing protein [Candidatus Dojkabacteria bacterium]HRP37442.1 DUF2975 domain-containing protein [Candidatus Dojkabacteria bacterium]HRP50828.1 DUF2975 domain-containing protein [Candidatus Dojkabacteria bacterium]